ncbi:MAG: ATP phosphoribosyltransferase regulatory subunit [Anaerotignum sp.]|nr:ATP phosphoribosyltransferase regulatory subunit [Anaerotignum sp.]
MKQAEMLLKKEEQVIFTLRALFEQYGYKKFKMSKFEEYDFYADNRSFLSSETILTFTGLDGKLLALKPDVTLSIVKNTKGSRENAERVYYNENVYRARKGAGEYKEIMQVGLEYIGEIDEYATLEVLLLAQKSLKAISEQYIMDLSHMGFVAGLMEEVNLPYAQQKAVLSCISDKNAHGIRAICMEADLAEEMTKKMEALASLYGGLESTLEQAKALCCNEKMEQAVAELEGILRCLKIGGNEKNVNLDFSIVNDMDYYTGVIFQGFINGVPCGILSGGRYDNLLHKMGKDADAIGFAVYLDLLERFETTEKEYDVDTLLLYEDGVDTAALAKAAQMLTDNGQSVLVQKKNTGNVKYKQLLCMKDRGLEIVAELD